MKTYNVILNADGEFHVKADSYEKDYGPGYDLIHFYRSEHKELVLSIESNLVEFVKETD